MRIHFGRGESTPFYYNITERLEEFHALIMSAEPADIECMRQKFLGVQMVIRGSRIANGHDELLAVLKKVALSLEVAGHPEFECTCRFINCERPPAPRQRKERKECSSSVAGSTYGAFSSKISGSRRAE